MWLDLAVVVGDPADVFAGVAGHLDEFGLWDACGAGCADCVVEVCPAGLGLFGVALVGDDGALDGGPWVTHAH